MRGTLKPLTIFPISSEIRQELTGNGKLKSFKSLRSGQVRGYLVILSLFHEVTVCPLTGGEASVPNNVDAKPSKHAICCALCPVLKFTSSFSPSRDTTI
jgi:hypothetical protein